jgi:tetratricopeptide (TPR) repeat protein
MRPIVVALAMLLSPPASRAAAAPGLKVEDVQLPAAGGGQAHLLPSGASIHVLVFVKPNHPRCVEALQELASREGKPNGARWAAVVPGDTAPAEARALAAAGGVKMPFLIDVGDQVYGKLALALHPSVVIIDRQGRLASVESYRRIQYADRVVARIRFTLGEITAAQLAEEEDPSRAEEHSDDGVAKRHEKFATKLFGLDQLDLALTEVNKGLATTPSAGGYNLQARILKRLGRCEEASKALAAAAKIDPRAADVVASQEPCPPHGSRVQ